MLDTLDWISFVSFVDVNESVECLSKVVSDLVDVFFPIKHVRVKHQCLPWGITPKITLLNKSFVLPLFDYCGVVWYSGFMKHAAMVDRLHRYAQKLTNFLLSDDFSTVRRVGFHLLTCVYKVLMNLCPSYLSDSFRNTKDVTKRHSNRNPYSLYIQSINSKLSFYYRGTVAWNRLNPDLYNCTSLQSFKSLYKRTCTYYDYS